LVGAAAAAAAAGVAATVATNDAPVDFVNMYCTAAFSSGSVRSAMPPRAGMSP
jgi:hypothetical protein